MKEKEEEERLRKEEEARWHNIPAWKKQVIEKQAKKAEVCTLMNRKTSQVALLKDFAFLL